VEKDDSGDKQDRQKVEEIINAFKTERTDSFGGEDVERRNLKQAVTELTVQLAANTAPKRRSAKTQGP
jgi:hypothetical protein